MNNIYYDKLKEACELINGHCGLGITFTKTSNLTSFILRDDFKNYEYDNAELLLEKVIDITKQKTKHKIGDTVYFVIGNDILMGIISQYKGDMSLICTGGISCLYLLKPIWHKNDLLFLSREEAIENQIKYWQSHKLEST